MRPLLHFVLLALSLTARAGVHQKEILSALYDAQIARADSLLDIAIQANPDFPEYYFLKAHHAFYARYFSPQPLSRDSMLNIVDWNSRKTIELAERESAHRQNKFYLGSAYGLLSRVHLMRQELWDGYWAARNCRSYLEEVLKEDSTFYDAYVGLGVIEYYPSRLTGMQSFLSWLGGMGGDGEKGIEYFRKAAANGDLLKTEATLILAYVARNFEADFAIADALFSSLQDEFPGNGFFKTQGLQAKLGMRIETEGISFLREDLHGARNEYRITSSGVLNAMAYAFMGRGDHATARDIFELNIELFPDEANPHDSIAECYALIGNNEEAVRHSRIALEKLPGDTTISDEFRENLREILQDRLKALGATPGV